MSLKDDFLEALRSVKKDFFKDYTGPDDNATAAESTAAPTSEDVFIHSPAATETPIPQASSPGELPREETQEERDAAFDAFLRASALNQVMEENLHNDVDDEYLAADVDTTPFRTLDDDAGGSGADQTSDLYPANSGRFVFDNTEGMDDTERTVISRNTVIRGALQTEDSVRMFGQILGDIDCKSNILLAGKVRGNTSAANAYIIDAQVDGNLMCDDVVNINDDAWILGNIRAQQAEIDGKVKGNIEIRHTISIGSSSSVIGNISTDELEIKRGAFINGQIMMYSPSRDVIDRFDQFGL